ncbi:hypothetical protein [Rubrobacter xylanophilus]|uniref:hypothetical protein n=1 Tax=Rubrobacter xylanophilus TaxID=49319 RepID=UPI00117B4F56|nr:hypothetical protein [Rubrobacter xylanophilus]
MNEGVIQSVYPVGCSGANGDEERRVDGVKFLAERGGGSGGEVGFGEFHGGEAAVQGVEDAGAGGVFQHQHQARGGVAGGEGTSLSGEA